MKLQLNHIAPYLPYALKGYFIDSIDIVLDVEFENGIIGGLNNGAILITDFKPILKSLLDLTKDQKDMLKALINGGSVIKYHYVSILTRDDLELDYVINKTPYVIIQKLIKWHYDIYGLIPEQLAIDAKTL